MDEFSIWHIVVLIGGLSSVIAGVFTILKFAAGQQKLKSATNTKLRDLGVDVKALEKADSNQLGPTIHIPSADQINPVPLESIEVLFWMDANLESRVPGQLFLGTKGLRVTPWGSPGRSLFVAPLKDVSDIEEVSPTGALIRHLNDGKRVDFDSSPQRELWLNTWRYIWMRRELGEDELSEKGISYDYPLKFVEKGTVGSRHEVRDVNGAIICRTSPSVGFINYKFVHNSQVTPSRGKKEGDLNFVIYSETGVYMGKLVRNKKGFTDFLSIVDEFDNFVATVDRRNTKNKLVIVNDELAFRVLPVEFLPNQYFIIPAKPVTISREHENLILISFLTFF